MNQTIVDAIVSGLRLRFVYAGRPRLVTPQCYGIGARGTELLRATLIGEQFRVVLFDVQKIRGLRTPVQRFSKRNGKGGTAIRRWRRLRIH